MINWILILTLCQAYCKLSARVAGGPEVAGFDSGFGYIRVHTVWNCQHSMAFRGLFPRPKLIFKSNQNTPVKVNLFYNKSEKIID